MTPLQDILASGVLFLVFSTFALWFLRYEYRRRGRLGWFGSLVHILLYAVHGMFCGMLAEGLQGRLVTGALAWVGIPLMVVGLGITLVAMDLFRTFSRWVGSATPGLRTGGLYRFSRNPQFAGYGLLLLGSVLTWWNSLLWIALPTYAVLVYLVARVEEEHLLRIYGDEYRDYCTRVRRFL